MARKTATAPAARPTAETVAAAVRRGDYSAAVVAAQTLHAAAPTPEHFALLRSTLTTAAGHFADADRYPEFARTMADAEALPPGDRTFTAELAALYARGGNLPRATELATSLADPAVTAAVTAHTADRAVRFRTKSQLPADLHAGHAAVLLAFEKYEAGHDDAARAALEPIGLRSPFLDWKLLVRGLIAYSAADDLRAADNFARLAPARLPARLAAPLRAAVDPAFRAAVPPETVAALDSRLQAFTTDAVVAGLRAVRGELGRDKPLSGAFRHAESLVPKLTRVAPHLVPRVATAVYRAILHHGEPSDLPKFRRVFGSPPDDPDFHRLEALVFEDSRLFEEANRHWASYEKWLAGSPAGWPPAVATRARAIVLTRMAKNLGTQAADAADGPPSRRKKPADPTPHLRKAADLAPDWIDPAGLLFDHLAAAGKLDEAEAVARKLLAANPGALRVADALAGRLQLAGRAADALDLRKQLLAANPLDKRHRLLAAGAFLAAARTALVAGDPAAADRTLDAGRDICEDETTAGYFALRSTIARKAGQKAAADEFAAKAVAAPGGRLAALLFLAADGVLAKLKPAERKPLDAALADGLTGPAGPLEANLLYAAWDAYHLDGVTYRGQKTQEKKIQAVVLRAAESDGPEFHFENLARGLQARQEWNLLLKLAVPLRKKFPANPVFPLMLAECEFGKSDGYPQPYRVIAPLTDAKRFAEASPEPRHKALLERISDLQKRAAPPDMLDFLFNRGFR